MSEELSFCDNSLLARETEITDRQNISWWSSPKEGGVPANKLAYQCLLNELRRQKLEDLRRMRTRLGRKREAGNG